MKRILLVVCVALTLRAGAGDKPNILLIISDDQAWTDYTFTGQAGVATPHLDKLANESLTFRRGYVTCSLCSPSLASLITGRYPHETTFTGNEPPLPKEKPAARYKDTNFLAQVDAQIRHLAEMPRLPSELAKAGYVSLQTGKWWGGNFSHGGFTHGMSKHEPEEGGRHGDEGLTIGRKTMQPIYDFIENAGDKPWLVWYAPMMPHQPHTPPERFLTNYLDRVKSPHVAKYYAMCEWFDETCGQLLDYLDDKKLSENTIVVYLSDNGWVQDPDSPKFDPRSKNAPYDLGIRQPIMIRWPNKIAAHFDDTPVSSVDVAPTLYKACGVEIPQGLPGINLLDEKAVKARKAVFGSCGLHNAIDITAPEKNTTYRWVVAGRYKLIVPNPDTVKEPLVSGHGIAPELYDLWMDPFERNDLSANQPDTVAELRTLLDGWWDGGPVK